MSSKKAQPIIDDEAVERDISLLNSMQRLFVEKLLATREFNSTEAARQAGYAYPHVAGAKLMRDKRIQRLVGKLIHERSQQNGIDAQRVFEELAAIAFFNIQDTVDQETGEPLHLMDLPDNVARCVKKFRVNRTELDDGTEVVEYEYEFWDKLEALEMLAKHLGILEQLAPQVDVNVFGWKDIMDALARPPVDPLAAKRKELPSPGVRKETDRPPA